MRLTQVALVPLAAFLASCADLPTASTESSASAGSAPALSAAGIGNAGVLKHLAAVRRATARYHDIDAAMADGYTVWSPNPFVAGATCPSTAEGNMGYHLVNVALRGGAGNPAAGDATITPLQPEMLLYEKRADGKMHLVGVEYIVFQAAWERVHGAGAPAPTVFGQPLLPGSHSFVTGGPSIPHYELHVWIWSHNPLGMFYPWNPSVSC